METLSQNLEVQNIVQRLTGGDESALAEIQTRFRPFLMAVISKVLSNSDESEDVFQDVLIQLWNRIDTFDPAKGNFTSWMATMARRRAIDHVRKICAYRRASDRFEVECRHETGRRLNDHEDDWARSDVRNLIDRQLDLLPDPQKQAISLAYLEGRSQREIAALTHTPLGTVKTRIELGLKKLTHAIAESRAKIV